LQAVLSGSFGKAAFSMAKALSEAMPDIITEGIVITKYEHAKGRIATETIRVFEAGHPVPDENGYAATKQVIEMLNQSDDRALVLCLISGGGSALLTSPYSDVTLGEKQLITGLLLKAGANIKELNTVRKTHLCDKRRQARRDRIPLKGAVPDYVRCRRRPSRCYRIRPHRT
jgi:glycerate-2-kinase